MISPEEAETFNRCIAAGGVVVFPADTVYGLACDPDDHRAVGRMYALKGRPPDKPSAIMFFRLDLALDALPDLGERTRAAIEALLPGGVTLLVPNPGGRFPLATAPDGTLGVRVPALPPALEALEGVQRAVLQSSANRTGGPDPRTLADVPEDIRRGADLVIDGGELPGTPSTVVDLRAFDSDRRWSVLREGAVSTAELEERIGAL